VAKTVKFLNIDVERGVKLFYVGLALIFLGVLLVFLAPFLALMRWETPKNGVEIGGAVGCVVIFFVPICFGVGAPGLMTWGLVAAAALLFVVALFMWLISRRLKNGGPYL
jgi:Protein of unknown function DUF131.